MDLCKSCSKQRSCKTLGCEITNRYDIAKEFGFVATGRAVISDQTHSMLTGKKFKAVRCLRKRFKKALGGKFFLEFKNSKTESLFIY